MKRLTDDELLILLNDTESDRAERKESFSKGISKKARQAVCAFANDLPGYNGPGVLFVGAKDNGEPSRVEITDQLLISLADMNRELEKNGNPELEFEVNQSTVQCIIRRKP